jgi:hypothetical protein
MQWRRLLAVAIVGVVVVALGAACEGSNTVDIRNESERPVLFRISEYTGGEAQYRQTIRIAPGASVERPFREFDREIWEFLDEGEKRLLRIGADWDELSDRDWEITIEQRNQ